MKKLMAMVLAAALAVSLFGCGSATPENASPDASAAGSAAAISSAGGSQSASSAQSGSQSGSVSSENTSDNPIDQFYQPLLDSAYDNATMTRIAGEWQAAWHTELEALAAQKEEQLQYPEDRQKVKDFVAAVENEAAAMTDLKELSYSDTEVAPADRTGAIGTGFSSDADLTKTTFYRVAFQQLQYTFNYENAENYSYTFDATAAQTALEG